MLCHFFSKRTILVNLLKKASMKKSFIFSLYILSTGFLIQSFGQTHALKPAIKLIMPLTAEDIMPGTRGASVVWHPVQKKYYAAMAGNKDYPLAVFDAKGKRISKDSLKCMQDVRGLWYNPDVRIIQGNTYNDDGWFSYILDAKGYPAGSQSVFAGQLQPGLQSIGAYDFKKKTVLFVHEGRLYSYYIKDGIIISDVEINWGLTKSSSPDDLAVSETDDYNSTTVIYTGIKDAEIGFLNNYKRQIELYDLATCHLAKTLTLPDDAKAETTFNFAYTNGIYWLFDMEGRTWHGYK